MSEDWIEGFVGEEVFVAPWPELFAENVVYLQSFMDLATSRPSGFGVSAIPVSEIGEYFDRAGLADDFLTFLRMMRACDDALLKWFREKDKGDRAEGRRP